MQESGKNHPVSRPKRGMEKFGGGATHPIPVWVHGPCRNQEKIVGKRGMGIPGELLTLSQSGYIVHAGIWFIALLRMLGDSVLALCRVGFFF